MLASPGQEISMPSSSIAAVSEALVVRERESSSNPSPMCSSSLVGCMPRSKIDRTTVF